MISDLQLFAADGRHERRPGETVDLVVRWQFPRKPVLEFRLLWVTRGKGSEDRDVVLTHRFTPALVEGQLPFRVVMPQSPYSFSGKLVSLVWRAEITGDGMRAQWTFLLSPHGREILLHAPAPVG